MKKIIVSIVAVLLMAMANVVTVMPSEASAASGTCTSHFLGVKAWYDGLTGTNCDILSPTEKFGGGDDAVRKYVWTIALNITSMILGIVGYLAIGLVMWGGIQYITAQGDVSKAVRGKKTVTNSIIGLVIVMSASIISSTVSGIITKARDDKDFFLSIFNEAFFWAGVITCIMIVWGGIQYITSTGNPQGVVKAKNTILYSAIGLIIVIFAATIVNTVVGSL